MFRYIYELAWIEIYKQKINLNEIKGKKAKLDYITLYFFNCSKIFRYSCFYTWKLWIHEFNKHRNKLKIIHQNPDIFVNNKCIAISVLSFV